MSDTCLQEQSTQDCTVACMVDRMVPITVAEQSHGEEAREKEREGASDESTDGSDIAKWCAGLKHPCDVKMLH